MIEDFFKITTNLKKISRKGWETKLGITNPESVADHSYSMSVIAMILADMQKLDTLKVIKMGLLHDLAESIVGDYTPEEISKNEKNQLENNAMIKIFNNLPQNLSKNYLSIWKEYQDKKTREAIFLHEVDKFEMAIQAIQYYDEGVTKEKLKPFFDAAKNGIISKEIKEYLAKLLP